MAPGPVIPLPNTVILLAAPTSSSPAVPGDPWMFIIGAIGVADVSVMM